MASSKSNVGSESNLAKMVKDFKAKGGKASDVLGEEHPEEKSTKTISEVGAMSGDAKSEKMRTEVGADEAEGEIGEISSVRKIKKEPVAKKASSSRKRPTPSTPQVPVRQSQRRRRGADSVAEEGIEAVDEEEAKGREVASELVVDRNFLAEHQLVEVSNLIAAQGWDHLFRDEVMVNEKMVREFYKGLHVEERSGLWMATFVINGETQIFTHKTVADILKVPVAGYESYTKGKWPPAMAKAPVILRVGEDPSNTSGQGNATKMGIVNRTLHQIVVHNITPRTTKHSNINYQDFLLVDQLLSKEPISLPKQIMQHMKHCVEGEKNGLPYPGLVRQLLIQFGVYQSDVEWEAFVKTDLRLFESIYWKYEAERGWINTRMGTPPPKPVAPLAAEPMNELPAVQEEGSQNLLELIRGMTQQLAVLTSKVEKLETIGNRFVEGEEYNWVKDLGKTAAKIETMPITLTEVEDSVNINLTRCTEIKEALTELNRQLRFVATEVVTQLKVLLRS